MKINKDLVDAVMMLSFISLVLVGTTDFSNLATKDGVMVGLGILTVVMVVFRIVELRQESHHEESHDY